MRKILILVVGVFFLVTVFVTPTMAKSFNLRVSSVYPPPGQALPSLQLVTWQEMVTKRTGGNVKFKNYWGAVLASPPEHLALVQKGGADIVVSYGWYTPSKLPLQDFDYVFPFGPTDPYIVTKACRKIYEEFPEFRESLAKYNCTRLFKAPLGDFVFLSKKPIATLDDFKGLKCALIGRYFGRWIGVTGAVPVTAPAGERYTMLQTGVVEASFNPIAHAYAFKDYEQGAYCLDPELFACNGISCWINLDSFNKLPKEYQKIMLDTGVELEEKSAKELNPVWTKKIYAELRNRKGFAFRKLAEKDRLIWAERCEDIPAEWAAEVTSMGFPGWDIVKRYQEITSELGHKWLRQWGIKK